MRDEIITSNLRKAFSLKLLYTADKNGLFSRIWYFDTNVLVDNELQPRCEAIIKNGNFRVSIDVLDELTRGKPSPHNPAWHRGRKLAEYILEHHRDKILKKPSSKIISELREVSQLTTKNYIYRKISGRLKQIYDLFQRNDRSTLDNFIHILNKDMSETLKRDFKKRAGGIIQHDKIGWITDLFVQDLRKSLIRILHIIEHYSHYDFNTCKRILEETCFRPLDNDINIAASYIMHRKPQHHLASNDKDVIELIVLHECRAA